MQIQPNNLATITPEEKVSPYTCIKCKRGYMLPAIEEGEPEYTEHYVCQKCGFHDTIPTVAIIASQMFSAIVGIAICLYLLLDLASYLGEAELLSTVQVLQHTLLISISGLFVVGFIYVLYQSFKGTIHRRAYTSGNHS